MHYINGKGRATAYITSLQPWQACEARAVTPEDGVVGDKVGEGAIEKE